MTIYDYLRLAVTLLRPITPPEALHPLERVIQQEPEPSRAEDRLRRTRRRTSPRD